MKFGWKLVENITCGRFYMPVMRIINMANLQMFKYSFEVF